MKRIANFIKERKLKKQGYEFIAGVDEVGIGAWAGPIFACAIILSPKFRCKICDSKQLSESQREKIAKIIKKKNPCFGIGCVEREEIDNLGLSRAKKLVVRRALENLSKKPDFVLLDGLDFLKKLEYPYEFTIKGDEKIKSIACASIIAKVERDKVMRRLGKKFPKYKFSENKGYGTAMHQKSLAIHGPCEIHRVSYRPIKDLKI